MPAYVIVNLELLDAQRYDHYVKAVPALVSKHGGEYLVRGGSVEVIEGNWRPSRLVLLRFPDRQAVRALFDDPEYAPLKALRHEVAKTSIVAVDGLDSVS
jgi:uncharacterized protein (DUF1330 family)